MRQSGRRAWSGSRSLRGRARGRRGFLRPPRARVPSTDPTVRPRETRRTLLGPGAWRNIDPLRPVSRPLRLLEADLPQRLGLPSPTPAASSTLPRQLELRRRPRRDRCGRDALQLKVLEDAHDRHSARDRCKPAPPRATGPALQAVHGPLHLNGGPPHELGPRVAWQGLEAPSAAGPSGVDARVQRDVCTFALRPWRHSPAAAECSSRVLRDDVMGPPRWGSAPSRIPDGQRQPRAGPPGRLLPARTRSSFLPRAARSLSLGLEHERAEVAQPCLAQRVEFFLHAQSEALGRDRERVGRGR